jgi:hypothetical protein
MSVVGLCVYCGADLADDGGRTCDCRRSTLERVVAQAVRLSGETGRDIRAALREAASETRRAS